MSRHRAPSRAPYVVGAAVILALLGSLGGVIVHDSAERTPSPPLSATVTVTPATRTVTAPPARRDQVAIAHGLKPLAKLVKGDRVINEENPSRPLCTFQLWDGSIAQAVIQCGQSSRQIYVKTGFLTPVEPVK